MKRRKRINTCAICSSLNYEASRKAHRLMLKINHEENIDFFLEVQQRVVISNKSKVYTEVKIFGKWTPLDGRSAESFIGFELR
jgi:hypothetical protein